MPQSIPQNVIDKDHELEGRTERSTEALAKHRWHWTVDENNHLRIPIKAYARAVGRQPKVVRDYATGYAMFVERQGGAGRPLTLADAIRLAGQAEDERAMTEAIAEGLKQPVANVARGDNRTRRDIAHVARERAGRRGTDPVDEAREVAARHRQTGEMDKRHRDEARERRSIRFVSIEGSLAKAKRHLTDALREAEGVDFDAEEMDLMRSTIANVKALLNLIDARMAGQPDIDWDAEMAKLSGGA